MRLTTKRIEAATPITLAEFRADKDQLRAEFALSTRRLEMNVETLRQRLAEQLSDVNRKKTDLAVAKTEREAHLQIVRELEEREAEARRRILELEKEGADTRAAPAHARPRVRRQARPAREPCATRCRTIARRTSRSTARRSRGDYNTDIEALLAALATERARAEFLDNQSRTLIAQLEVVGPPLVERRHELPPSCAQRSPAPRTPRPRRATSSSPPRPASPMPRTGSTACSRKPRRSSSAARSRPSSCSPTS